MCVLIIYMWALHLSCSVFTMTRSQMVAWSMTPKTGCLLPCPALRIYQRQLRGTAMLQCSLSFFWPMLYIYTCTSVLKSATFRTPDRSGNIGCLQIHVVCIHFCSLYNNTTFCHVVYFLYLHHGCSSIPSATQATACPFHAWLICPVLCPTWPKFAGWGWGSDLDCLVFYFYCYLSVFSLSSLPTPRPA